MTLRNQLPRSRKREQKQVFESVIAAVKKQYGMELYREQIRAGRQMLRDHIVEMQTGEGKTLTALLPAAWHAMAKKGCHIVTSNDYLAKRDAHFAKPVLERLGLSVGYIQSGMQSSEKRAAYRCDVTYGTGSEMAFDFLHDQLSTQGETGMRTRFDDENMLRRREHYAVIVDEADNLLIDDSRTPLIIAHAMEASENDCEFCRWAYRITDQLHIDSHFIVDLKRRRITLTDAGCLSVGLLSAPTQANGLSLDEVFEQVEQSLLARFLFRRNRDYIVENGVVTIISESTGRQMQGRKWQRGLQSAIEVKEQVPISPSTHTTARISIQEYFRLYQYLSGMTGTAHDARREFRRYYKKRVAVIPTHKRCKRQVLPTRVFRSQRAKFAAIIESVDQLLCRGRAILIGTPSVQASVELSDSLNQHHVAHSVLNAIEHEEEARIVANAGQPGQVTIATNMAGRGTDIVLHDQVRRAGGLHLIATEFHTSRRIDRQLIGRVARQGDPGSCQFFVSLEDSLLVNFYPKLADRIVSRGRSYRDELPSRYVRFFRMLQRRMERQLASQRKTNYRLAKQKTESALEGGLHPFLEMVEESY